MTVHVNDVGRMVRDERGDPVRLVGYTTDVTALKRLDEQARRLERHARGPSVEQYIAQERQRSHEYGGRSVFGWEPPATGPVGQKKAS